MSAIRSFQNFHPVIASSAYVDPDAIIIGDVYLDEEVSIWPGVILRGDQGRIEIGTQTNIQDGTIAHATGGFSTVRVGARVTVGHRVLLHGCIVESDCLIGMGAILLDKCHVHSGSIIGAGSVVTSGTVIPEGVLAFGSPARVIRPLRPNERQGWIGHGCAEYLRLAKEYKEQK
jgi:carbonic anhydrase/acetyltransferase-like protein (isoleucine patch superfamily)